jgi:hypothetical protein
MMMTKSMSKRSSETTSPGMSWHVTMTRGHSFSCQHQHWGPRALCLPRRSRGATRMEATATEGDLPSVQVPSSPMPAQTQ